jgi:SAM-dependent methyltransferase
MANERGKHIDNTHLSIDQAEARGFIHRDYIAHCLRWTHVAKYLCEKQRYKTARVLDVGCGVDLPLARLLYSSRYIVEQYVGVDYNPARKFKLEPFHTGKFPISAYGDQAFPDDLEVSYPMGSPGSGVYRLNIGGGEVVEHALPTVITSFEVLEHVEPSRVRKMLAAMHKLLSPTPGAVAFISTPCWDPKVGAAANHVNEMTYTALGALLEDMGFGIQGVWGTFASQKDYKQRFISQFGGGQELWSKLSEYYDSNYLATILAPLYPQLARNALWRISPEPTLERQFPPLKEVEGTWTSSEEWQELAG